MAYMSQDRKKAIHAKLKTIIPPSWRWNLGVDHHNEIVLNVWEAPLDILGAAHTAAINNWDRDHRGDSAWLKPQRQTSLQLNHFWFRRHFEDVLSEDSIELVERIIAALNDGNHNNSDLMIDHHDVGWYVSVNFGRWNKPYVVGDKRAKKEAA